MRKFTIILALLFSMKNGSSFAQSEIDADTDEKRIDKIENFMSKLKGFSLSGRVTLQWQLAESTNAIAYASGGAFLGTNNRFAIRDGRIKLAYKYKISTTVVQIDLTEKGVSAKDVYIKLMSKDNVIGGQFGLYDRPFGYEISVSGAVRETPERSRIFNALFPGERDLGGAMILNGKNKLKGFALTTGVYNGNGIGKETDKYKDFIGRLSWEKSKSDYVVGGAFSYYEGSITNRNEVNYTYSKGVGFNENEDVELGSREIRRYYGFSAKYKQKWAAGHTSLRGEFIFGLQPGTELLSYNIGGYSLGEYGSSLYMRKINGGYLTLAHQILESKHTLVGKFDIYDPNTEIKGSEIGLLKNTGAADIRYRTFGVGYIYEYNKYLRFIAYYDFVKNESCANLEGYETRQKENVFTARVQAKF